MFLLERASFAIKLLDIVEPSDAVANPGAGGPEAILQSAKTHCQRRRIPGSEEGREGGGDVTGEGRKGGGSPSVQRRRSARPPSRPSIRLWSNESRSSAGRPACRKGRLSRVRALERTRRQGRGEGQGQAMECRITTQATRNDRKSRRSCMLRTCYKATQSPNATAVEGRRNKECGMGSAGSWWVFKCSMFLVIVPVCLTNWALEFWVRPTP